MLQGPRLRNPGIEQYGDTAEWDSGLHGLRPRRASQGSRDAWGSQERWVDAMILHEQQPTRHEEHDLIKAGAEAGEEGRGQLMEPCV